MSQLSCHEEGYQIERKIAENCFEPFHCTPQVVRPPPPCGASDQCRSAVELETVVVINLSLNNHSGDSAFKF
jgi:hypothetical protein